MVKKTKQRSIKARRPKAPSLKSYFLKEKFDAEAAVARLLSKAKHEKGEKEILTTALFDWIVAPLEKAFSETNLVLLADKVLSESPIDERWTSKQQRIMSGLSRLQQDRTWVMDAFEHLGGARRIENIGCDDVLVMRREFVRKTLYVGDIGRFIHLHQERIAHEGRHYGRASVEKAIRVVAQLIKSSPDCLAGSSIARLRGPLETKATLKTEMWRPRRETVPWCVASIATDSGRALIHYAEHGRVPVAYCNASLAGLAGVAQQVHREIVSPLRPSAREHIKSFKFPPSVQAVPIKLPPLSSAVLEVVRSESGDGRIARTST